MILGESVAFQAAGGALAFAFGAAFAALLFFAAFLEKKVQVFRRFFRALALFSRRGCFRRRLDGGAFSRGRDVCALPRFVPACGRARGIRRKAHSKRVKSA